MEYTKYFAATTKNEGRLKVDTYQFQRMMNIIHIEGVIERMNKIKATLNENEAYKYVSIHCKTQIIHNLGSMLNVYLTCARQNEK